MVNRKLLLGIGVLGIVDIIWVVSAELSEYIFHDSNFDKPLFTTYLKTSLFVIYLLGLPFVRRWRYQLAHITKKKEDFQAVLAKIDAYQERFFNENDQSCSQNEISVDEKEREVPDLSRMSDEEIKSLKEVLTEICERVTLRYTVYLALLFSILWVLATLMYQEALSRTSAAVTNILSSTSGIFTLLLAAIFPSSLADKFSVSKLLATLASFGGIFIICWTDPSREASTFNAGDIYALLGAIFYACYLVLVRRKVGDDGNLDIPLFLGFVGLFGLVLFWPVLILFHYCYVEEFELPSHKMTWVYLLLNGVIGTVLSEVLWLWGCFLTSSLMATLALGFVSPMTLVWDILIHHIKFSNLFFVGTIPIIISFILVSILTHFGDWDPIRDCFRRYCCKAGQSNIDGGGGMGNDGKSETISHTNARYDENDEH